LFQLLGDAISPAIVGAISDATYNLQLALTLVPTAIFIGGVIYFIAWKLYAFSY
jgi:hypothetical protein